MPSPCFSNFEPPLPPTSPPTVYFVALFLWQNGWWHHILCGFFVNYILDLHMLTLGTLVAEGPCCVFQPTRRQVYNGLTHNGVFGFQYHTVTHKQKHTAHSGANELAHPHKYIKATCYVLAAAICVTLNE